MNPSGVGVDLFGGPLAVAKNNNNNNHSNHHHSRNQHPTQSLVYGKELMKSGPTAAAAAAAAMAGMTTQGHLGKQIMVRVPEKKSIITY